MEREREVPKAAVWAPKTSRGAERGVSGRTHLLSAQTDQALVNIIVFRFLFSKEHQHCSLSVKMRERLRRWWGNCWDADTKAGGSGARGDPSPTLSGPALQATAMRLSGDLSAGWERRQK